MNRTTFLKFLAVLPFVRLPEIEKPHGIYGKPTVPDPFEPTCPVCGGSGVRVATRIHGGGVSRAEGYLPDHEGYSYVEVPCPKCQGQLVRWSEQQDEGEWRVKEYPNHLIEAGRKRGWS